MINVDLHTHTIVVICCLLRHVIVQVPILSLGSSYSRDMCMSICLCVRVSVCQYVCLYVLFCSVCELCCVYVCVCVVDVCTICDWICKNLPSTHKRYKIITCISLRLNYNSRQIMLHIC